LKFKLEVKMLEKLFSNYSLMLHQNVLKISELCVLGKKESENLVKNYISKEAVSTELFLILWHKEEVDYYYFYLYIINIFYAYK
jgi:hypothetical protein